MTQLKSTSDEESKFEELLNDKLIVENLLDDLDFEADSSSEEETENTKKPSTKKPNFSGVWNLQSHSNSDEFLIGMGIPWVMRKFVPLATMTETIEHNIKNDSMSLLVQVNVPFFPDTVLKYKMDNKPLKNINPLGESEICKTKWIKNNTALFMEVTNEVNSQKNFTEEIYLESQNKMIQIWTNVVGTKNKRIYIREKEVES